MLDDLNHGTDYEIKEKLQAAVQEALNDETYRKVKRMSYQSHNADEVIFTIYVNILSFAFQVFTKSNTYSSFK